MDAISIHLLGREAADRLTTKGIPLSKTIAEMAISQKLNQAQVKRIAGAANHAADAMMRKHAPDKTYTFELADIRDIIDMTQDEGAVADVSRVDATLAKVAARRSAEYVEKLASRARPKELVDADIRAIQLDLRYIEESAEAASRDTLAKMSALRADLTCDVAGLVTDIKEHLLAEGGDLGTLRKVASAYAPDSDAVWDPLFQHVSDELVKMGEPFTGSLADAASLKVDRPGRQPGPIDGPDVELINGKSRLVSRLEAVRTKLSIADALKYWKNSFNSLASTVRRDQKVIATSADVQPEQYAYAAEVAQGIRNTDVKTAVESLVREPTGTTNIDPLRVAMQTAHAMHSGKNGAI